MDNGHGDRHLNRGDSNGVLHPDNEGNYCVDFCQILFPISIILLFRKLPNFVNFTFPTLIEFIQS